MRIDDLHKSIAAAESFLKVARQVKSNDAKWRAEEKKEWEKNRSSAYKWHESPHVEPTGARLNGVLRAHSVILSTCLCDIRKPTYRED